MRSWRWTLAVGLVMVGIGVVLPPVARDTSHAVRLVLAGLGGGLALGWVGAGVTLGADGRRALLLGAGVLGAFNYWQFDPRVFVGPGDVTDITYYYLNSKYLDELDYDLLYDAMLLADEGRHTDHVETVRNLTDDTLSDRASAMRRGAEVARPRFTEARWAAFSHDTEYFLDRLPRETLSSNFFVDHGYNPPVTWTVLGEPLAR